MANNADVPNADNPQNVTGQGAVRDSIEPDDQIAISCSDPEAASPHEEHFGPEPKKQAPQCCQSQGVIALPGIEQSSQKQDCLIPMKTLDSGQSSKEAEGAGRTSRPLHMRTRSVEPVDRTDAATGGGGLRRTQSLKRRDNSWDRRWENQQRVGPIPLTAGGGRSWQPGRLDCSYWEGRSRAKRSTPPKASPPKMKLRDLEEYSPSPRMDVLRSSPPYRRGSGSETNQLIATSHVLDNSPTADAQQQSYEHHRESNMRVFCATETSSLTSASKWPEASSSSREGLAAASNEAEKAETEALHNPTPLSSPEALNNVLAGPTDVDKVSEFYAEVKTTQLSAVDNVNLVTQPSSLEIVSSDLSSQQIFTMGMEKTASCLHSEQLSKQHPEDRFKSLNEDSQLNSHNFEHRIISEMVSSQLTEVGIESTHQPDFVKHAKEERQESTQQNCLLSENSSHRLMAPSRPASVESHNISTSIASISRDDTGTPIQEKLIADKILDRPLEQLCCSTASPAPQTDDQSVKMQSEADSLKISTGSLVEDLHPSMSPSRRGSSALGDGLRLSPITNGKLLAAVQTVSAEFSHVLEQVTRTATPPAPLPRHAMPATPPPPPTPPPTLEDPEERCSLPSPPPEARQEATPPRPLPPRAPAPPERSISHSRLNSTCNSNNNSCNNTPTMQRRRIVVRAVQTPSPLPFPRQSEPADQECPNDGLVRAVPLMITAPDSSTEEATADGKEPNPTAAMMGNSGTFKAVPVTVDASLPEDIDFQILELRSCGERRIVSTSRRSFLSEMLSTEEQAAEAARQMRLDELRRLEEENRLEEIKLAKQLERKQKEVEDILKKKKEEEDRKRREAEELRQREESIRLKKAAEEKRKRDEEDKKMQQEREERMRREMESKERHRRSVSALERPQTDSPERPATVLLRSATEKAVPAPLKEKERILNEWPVSAQAFKGEAMTTKGADLVEQKVDEHESREKPVPAHVEIRIQAKNEARVSRPSSRNSFLNAPDDGVGKAKAAQGSSELVRVQNRLLQKNREHLDPADIFHQQIADAKTEEKFSMSNRWKDVKIGLVKDRASSYLKPDENQNFYGGYQQSPRMKRKILSPASWFKQQATPAQQPTESFHNAINISKHGPGEERTAREDGEEKENVIVGSRSSDSGSKNARSDSCDEREVANQTECFSGEVIQPLETSSYPSELENSTMKAPYVQGTRSPSTIPGRKEEIMLSSQNNSCTNDNRETALATTTPSSDHCAKTSEGQVRQTSVEMKDVVEAKLITNLVEMQILPESPMQTDVPRKGPNHIEVAIMRSEMSEQSRLPKHLEVDRPPATLKQTEMLKQTEVCSPSDVSRQTDLPKQPEVPKQTDTDMPRQTDVPRQTPINQKGVPGQVMASKQTNMRTMEETAALTAPWRRLEGNRSRSELKSPSLNLMSVSITPCSSAKDLSAGRLQQAVISRPQPVISDQGRLEVAPPAAGSPGGQKAAVEMLDETMKELQHHVESLGAIPTVSETAVIVTQAAASVKSAAGAVRSVAQSLLKAISPDLKGRGEEATEDIDEKILAKRPPLAQDLQEIKDLIAGRSKADPSCLWLPCDSAQDRGNTRRFNALKSKARAHAVPDDEETDDDSLGYEDDFSSGIDLPITLDVTSGNVTPIPTTGELEELSSVDENTVLEDTSRPTEVVTEVAAARSTPLKSLLKKPSLDVADSSSSDTDSEDGKVSPKKVHFSEIDQVKLMSQESLASMAASELNETMLPVTLCTAVIKTTAVPSVVKIVNSSNRFGELEKALGDLQARVASSQQTVSTHAVVPLE